jgi:acyl-CoA reductase-like NAD-dependent aldehyde dehydrogenase
MSSAPEPATRLLIDGKLAPGDATQLVINPATGAAFATAPRASLTQLNQAVAAAKAAAPSWARTAIAQRRKALADVATILEGHVGELAALLTREQGKPLADARTEVLRTIFYFRHFSTLDIPTHTLQDSAVRKVERHRVPLGVVAAIVPWNFPLTLMAFKVPPALLAGNTVIIKPAATTPLSTLRFGELVHQVFPPGVLNVIADANDLGAALTAHPDVRMVSFTGSTATGRRVMASAADSLKRLTLELGGNDAAIVLDDVDVDAVAPRIFNSAFRNSGQVCIAIKRLYVHDEVFERLYDKLVDLAHSAAVRDGSEAGAQFGPLQNRAQFDKVTRLLEEAREAGGVTTSEPAMDGAGYFIRPTIVRDLPDTATLVTEEQFGPVLPMLRFADIQDVLVRANASLCGLGASVWSADPERAYAVAKSLEAGTVWVNKHGELLPDVPFAGSKESGMGVELGAEGLEEFTQLKIINISS